MLIVRFKGLNSILCNIFIMNFKNNIEIYLKFCFCRVICILFYNFFFVLVVEFRVYIIEFRFNIIEFRVYNIEF